MDRPYRLRISLAHVISFSGGAFSEAPTTPRIEATTVSIRTWTHITLRIVFGREEGFHTAREIGPSGRSRAFKYDKS